MRGLLRGILVHGEMVKQLPEIPIHVEWCSTCSPQCQQLSGIISAWGQTSLQKPPHFAAPSVDVLWHVQHSPHHREGTDLQRNGCTLSNLCLGAVAPTGTAGTPHTSFSLGPDVFHPQCPGWEHRNAKQPLGPSWVATT